MRSLLFCFCALWISACMHGESQTRFMETGLDAAHLRARQKPLLEE